MKRTILLFALIATIFRFSWAQNKIALIVAVAEYPAGGAWKSLSSINDLKYVKAALHENGFPENNIDSLINEKATRVNILKALDKLQERAGEGDIVFFHFSGHGQQIEDDNNDEPDGYDEAIVPYDAKGRYDPVSYRGQNHLRDDELGVKLEAIQRKIGPQGSLVVILDACHSGTATRSSEFSVCRGTATPFQSPDYVPKNTISLNEKVKVESGFLKDQAANIIVISASSPNQVNYETKDQDHRGVGSLSFAFAKALSELKAGSDYRYLFEKIKSQIQADFPMQIPMIEGNTSQEIFSGHYTKQTELITIDKWYTDSSFSINQGILNGITTGTTIKIFPIGSDQPITGGYILQSGSLQSICIAKHNLKRSEAYRIVPDAVNNGEFSASIFIKTPAGKSKQSVALENQLKQFIKPYQYLSLNSNADFMLDITQLKNGAQSLSLIEKGDSIPWSATVKQADTLSAADCNELLSQIKRAMRIKYLRNISDGGSLSANVTVEIIPKIKSTQGNEIILKPLDLYSIKITNNGPYDLFYTIVDIMADNEVKVLLPGEESAPQEFIITAKSQPIVIDSIQVDAGTPMGKEFFKLFFSRDPIDLRSVFNRTKTRSIAKMQSIEEVMDDMFKDQAGHNANRSRMSNIKLDEIGIITVGFTIRK